MMRPTTRQKLSEIAVAEWRSRYYRNYEELHDANLRIKQLEAQIQDMTDALNRLDTERDTANKWSETYRLMAVAESERAAKLEAQNAEMLAILRDVTRSKGVQ